MCFVPKQATCTFVPPYLRRLLGRSKLKTLEDSYCGLCIIVLYFTYLTVTKGALSVFDYSKNSSGVYLLDADPSIQCNQVCVYKARRTNM